MSAIACVLFWCAVQVTVFAASALVLNGLIARRQPAAGARVAFYAFIAVVGLTLSAFSPWPRWRTDRDVFAALSATPNVSVEPGIPGSESPAISSALAGAPAGKLADHPGATQEPEKPVKRDPPTAAPTASPADGELAQPLCSRQHEQSAQTASDPVVAKQPSPAPLSNRVLEPGAAVDWLVVGAIIYAAGVGIAALRFLVGMVAVRNYRRRSALVSDASLRNLAEALCSEMRCARRVDLREVDVLRTPATIGWLRPVILLPAEWPTWTPQECRAVLAHEIAHVRRGDFSSWVVAQVGVALHFYHPLIHWLAGRLRLEQELAADAAAAAVMKGEREYLSTLAAMALRQSASAAPWPARAFLPTPKTFLRRIEMLRRSKSLNVEVSRPVQVLSVAAVAAAAMLASGFRAPIAAAVGPPLVAAAEEFAADGPAPPAAAGVERPAGTDQASPRDDTKPAQPSDNREIHRGLRLELQGRPPAPEQGSAFPTIDLAGQPSRRLVSTRVRVNQLIDLAYVPRDAVLVAAVRPASILSRPGINPLSAVLKSGEFARWLPVPFERIEQVTAVALPAWKSIPVEEGTPKLQSVIASLGGFFVRVVDAADAKMIVTRLGAVAEVVEYAGHKYLKGNACVLPVGDRTFLIAAEESFLRRMIVAGPAGPGKAFWAVRPVTTVAGPNDMNVGSNTLNALADWDFCAIMQMDRLLTSDYLIECRGIPVNLLNLQPRFDEAEIEIVTARLRNHMDLVGSLVLQRQNAIIDASFRWRQFVDRDRREFSRQRDVLSRQSDSSGARQLLAVEAAEALLDLVRIKQDGIIVNATAVMDAEDVARFAPALALGGPQAFANESSQTDAVKARHTLNNLKRLGLAMHNYHDANRHFPAAVVMGPDGKTPHSWRIELLPYLDAAALYTQYRKDEPWDSPANKRVLAKMPDVFRSPYDDPKSMNSGYFVLVGPGTIFEGTKGIGIDEIVDGTSNTLLVIEAKRNIPWTKPEDIPFDPNGPLPALGGFVKGWFAADLADGSARTVDVETNQDQLKWLIMRNDLHVVQIPSPPTRLGRPISPPATIYGQRRTVTPPPTVDAKTRNTRNNLKQIVLAMHNYHDVHRHFPPAVLTGPDGKTPRSWRVELLPYLNAAALYEAYRKDEPWDSPANKEVLAKMPEVFHSPYDDPKSRNSAYFALVGPGTPFEGTQGIRVSDITDGTSNTLLVVEAKRNIPWTKPEDIAFDAEKPLPELGGFVNEEFASAMADGSVHIFETAKIKDQLKWLIIRNDAHPVRLP